MQLHNQVLHQKTGQDIHHFNPETLIQVNFNLVLAKKPEIFASIKITEQLC